MEPYIIIPLLVTLAGVLCLMVKVRRLERENRQLRIQCTVLEAISKSLFAVSDRLIDLHDDLDRHNRCEPTSTPEKVEQ